MNLTYTEFKQRVIAKFLDYLPEEYQNWSVRIDRVPKINGFLEALSVSSPEYRGAVPNIYLQDMYRHYQDCRNLDEVLRYAGRYFVTGMDYVKKSSMKAEHAVSKDNIVFCLISGDRNEELLEMVPHRRYLDMAIIYRVMIPSAMGGFNSSIITNGIVENMGLDEDALYRIAMENTPRILPPTCEHPEMGMILLTNTCRTLGASVILYPEFLAGLAKAMNTDLVLFPSSIHEFFVMPDVFESTDELDCMVKEANERCCEKAEVLSDHVYFYDRKKGKLEIMAGNLS